MLPVVRKRALHIPHGLAAVAAALCLALAFTTDIKDRQDRILVERSEPAPVSLSTAADDSRSDPAARIDQRGEQAAREATVRRKPRQLLPWFPGLGVGGE